ncbi:MAG: SDR family oxidoreductase [Candidatus Omnitrophica bacterium]|jgi:nucleoside-diphosphate-sugar epimerase|nr:SDR family oxidoreductase [Candidatus Omnitrophota bacterium]
MFFNKKVLVTGGAGFIGSHIVDALVKNNCQVRVLDNFSSGKLDNLSGVSGKVKIIKGDICDRDTCRKAVSGVDVVFHQAALRSVPKSMKNPDVYNKVNIGGILNMLEASRENNVKAFVFASSSSVYGDVSKFPEKESFFPGPISPYALSKLAGEYYCKIFSLHYGVPAVSLRYFNVFGPRQSLDDEYAVVVPKFIDCLLRDNAMPIYGTGRQSRDFTFVANAVQANLLAASCALKGKVKSGVFNVAGGRDYSVLELASILNKILGKKIKPVFLPKRQGDVFRTKADLTLSKKLLGFKPQVNFTEGLKITVEYFQLSAVSLQPSAKNKDNNKNGNTKV